MAYIQDQSYTNGQDNDDLGVGKLRISSTNNQIIGQSFTPAVSGQLSAFAFSLKRIGSPTGNVWIEIHADGADPSAATLLATSSTVNAVTGVGTGYEWIHFYFPTATTLTSGTVYWALLYGDYSYGASDNVFMGIDTSSPTYAGGSYGRYGNGGAAWETLSTYDSLFRAYNGQGTLWLYDATSYANNIIINGGVVPSSSVPSTLSGAQYSAEFDRDDMLWVPDSASLSITGSVTIEGWCYNTGDEGMVLWNKYSGAFAGEAGYSSYIQGDESLIFNASTDGTVNWAKYTAAAVFTKSQWDHYAFVYSSAGPTISLYKNGVLTASPNTVGTVTSGIHDSTDFGKIFSTVSTGTPTMRVCDVRIWDTARSGGEITANMNRFLNGNESHLMANYQFRSIPATPSGSFFL